MRLPSSTLLIRFGKSERGVAAVEFALISTVLMMLFLGLIDYAIAVFRKMELTSAVRAGAQYAMVNTGAATTEVESAVAAATSLSLNTNTTTEFCECSENPGTTVDCAPSASVCSVRRNVYANVNATYTYTWLFLPDFMKSATNVTMSATSTVRVE